MSHRHGPLPSERANVVLSWLLTAVVLVAAIESLLTAALLWAGFALLVVVVLSLPAVTFRDWAAIVPWPPLAVTTLAMGLRSSGLYPETAGYLAIASLALILVVELDMFTRVEMSYPFAVGFAMLLTMACQGGWTVAQYYSDRWTGTEFLRTQTELQWDMVVVTAVGLVVGGLFLWYFDRFGYLESSGETGGETQ